jgi:hypothetical protein
MAWTPQIISDVTKMLHRTRSGIHRLQERLNQHFSGGPLRIGPNSQMRLIVDTGADRLRENLLIANEVAAVVSDQSRECEAVLCSNCSM